jgi:peptide/nickel transport system ATP-binding protein
MSAPLLHVENLGVAFATPRGELHAVSDVSFDLMPGERLGLVGESGSGKSTTILALQRLIRPPGRVVGGRAIFEDRDLLALAPEDMRALRFKRIALVPQGAMNALNPVLRIAEQLDDVIAAHDPNSTHESRGMRIDELLRRVDLEHNVARLFPHQLSGGMKQRVCIAMSIALGPSLIFADEPTSALDVVVQRQVLGTLAAAQAAIGAAIVIVGHDMGLMAQFAHRIGVMYAGRLVELAPVREIFARPRHPYTRALIASLPTLVRRTALVGIPGIAPSLLDPQPGCSFHPRCTAAIERCRSERPLAVSYADAVLVACHRAGEGLDATAS